jgi:6-phospho-beta-glucosidase
VRDRGTRAARVSLGVSSRRGKERRVKLCILGGGGFRTPYVYAALLHDTGDPRVSEVALYDIDEDRLRSMTRILQQLAAGVADAPVLRPTTSLRAAIEGSDFVFAAIRVGGLEGRRCDEHVALELGVLGQETTGAGGLAYAFRTVPVMLEVARLVRELAPQAYVLNFTNPAGIITEAMQSVLGERVLGICDTPSDLGRRVAGLMGVEADSVQLDYVGLNHLGWLRRVLQNETDLLPALLADDDRLSRLEETDLFGADWLRLLGAVPNEYLYYYYLNRDAVTRITSAAETRGDFLARTQTTFFTAVRDADDGGGRLWRETVAARNATYMAEARSGHGAPGTDQPDGDHPDEADRDGNGGLGAADEIDPAQQGYAGVALQVMTAVSRGEPATLILNVRNGTTIAGLPPDAVVEVPTLVDASGVHPLTVAPPTLHQLGLMQQVKDVERHAINAARHHSLDEALLALALHPLVDSITVARQLLAGYLERIPEVADALRS